MWLGLLVACRGTILIDDTTTPPASVDSSPAPPGVVEDGALVAFDRPPRNVLMLSLDTLRRDHIDRYATDGVVRMPFLSDLLARSVALDDHVQGSDWTQASVTATLQGRYLEEGDFMPTVLFGSPPVPAGAPSLARVLSDAGFHTMLYSSNRFFSEDLGTAQGYDAYELKMGAPADQVLQAGAELLQQAPADQPWMLHLHFYDPHHSYTPPDGFVTGLGQPWDQPWDLSTEWGQNHARDLRGTLSPEDEAHLDAWLRAGYDGELRWLDDQLAVLWGRLEEAGRLDDTLVVIWTDHGEAFFEHGFDGHGKLLAQEENDAILAFWAPDLAPVAWSGPTHAVDLVPTLLHALQLPLPDGLSGEVAGLADPHRPRFAATSGYQGVHQMVIVDGVKLHFGWRGELRMWDRDEDRAEQVDVYDPDDPRAVELWGLLEPRVRMLEPLLPWARVEWPASR